MRLSSQWGHRPYLPLSRMKEKNEPFIVRLAPFETGVCLEWMDAQPGPYTVTVTPVKISINEDKTTIAEEKHLSGVSVTVEGKTAEIDGLQTGRDYMVTVSQQDVSGRFRLFKTGKYPDRIVHYLHPADEVYAFSGRSLCSPSIVKLPSGALLCSMDVFASKGPQNLTLVFRSDDGGASWRYVTDLFPCFWGKLFVHRETLYMLGHASEYGMLMIGKSEDEGQTWSAPVFLVPGAGQYSQHGPHKAPMPVISHKGRLWTAIDYGCWTLGGHSNALLSVDEYADLMCTENWVLTDLCEFDPSWPGVLEGFKGCIEGNAVVGPDGVLYNMLRHGAGRYPPEFGRAVLLKADAEDPHAAPVFDRVIPFNGAQSKFVVLKDEVSGLYFSISNLSVDSRNPVTRYTLALKASKDLVEWKVLKILIDRRHENPKEVGFQYPDFLFDGDDIVYASRTAVNGARNFHDANCTTVGRVKNFRDLANAAFPGK